MGNDKPSDENTYTDPEGFRIDVSTAALNHGLKAAKDIDSFLGKNKKNMIPRNLPIHLEMLLEKKGLNPKEYLSMPCKIFLYHLFKPHPIRSRTPLS